MTDTITLPRAEFEAMRNALKEISEGSGDRWAVELLRAALAQQAEPAQKGCDMCKDPDGVLCFPQYGVGPHTCFYKIPGAKVGQSQPLPKDQWPTNYQEDPDCPGMGVYWCPHCGSGKPAPDKNKA